MSVPVGVVVASSLPLLSRLESWARFVMESLGYPGIAALVAIENLFPPIPSEVVLPLAGFFVSRGTFHFAGVWAAATVGSVAGAWALYAVGSWLGKPRVYDVVDRFGHILLLREADLDRSFAWFDEHDEAAVLFGRLVPLVRSLVSIPAGLQRMRAGRFTAYTAVGSGAWNLLLVTGGWWLGEEWNRFANLVKYVEYVGVAAIGLLVVAFFVRRWRRESA